jgi:hypothetical protein
VAVTNLDEGQSADFVGFRLGSHLGSEGERSQNAALNQTKRASPSPRHALQKPAAVDSVMVVVMLDKAVRVRIE